MLTDTAVRNAKPREKPYKLTDGGGLYVIVNPNGSRWWRFRYRVAGREKLISLGVYPEVSLRVARERRDDLFTELQPLYTSTFRGSQHHETLCPRSMHGFA